MSCHKNSPVNRIVKTIQQAYNGGFSKKQEFIVKCGGGYLSSKVTQRKSNFGFGGEWNTGGRGVAESGVSWQKLKPMMPGCPGRKQHIEGEFALARINNTVTTRFSSHISLRSDNFGTTYPDPLPPTMATLFPAGTLKVRPFKIFCPGM